jgi:hypothetical protein
MSRRNRYQGGTPEDEAALNEHAERKRSPMLGKSSANKNGWMSIGAAAELAQQIAEELDKPPVTDDAEKLHMGRAIRSRNHVHDIEALQREKLRVLKCRQ